MKKAAVPYHSPDVLILLILIRYMLHLLHRTCYPASYLNCILYFLHSSNAVLQFTSSWGRIPIALTPLLEVKKIKKTSKSLCRSSLQSWKTVPSNRHDRWQHFEQVYTWLLIACRNLPAVSAATFFAAVTVRILGT